MDILGKIRRLQEERGWSENHLAEQAHLSQSTINSLYRKGNVPTIPTLEAICRAFGMTISQFLAEDSLPPDLTGEQGVGRAGGAPPPPQKLNALVAFIPVLCLIK